MLTRKKKVLIVGAFPPVDRRVYGGVLTVCKLLCTSKFSDVFDLILIDTCQISNPPPGLIVRLVYAVRRLASYLKSLLFDRPDVILLFTTVGSSILEKGLMAWMGRPLRVPIFMFPRGATLLETHEHSPLYRYVLGYALCGANYILCQGLDWQRFAVDRLGYSEDTAPVVYNWSATRELLDIGDTRCPDCDKQVIDIIFLGWLEREKGIFELLAACRELAQRYRFSLTIAGYGRAEGSAKEFVERSGLSGHVKFVGWVAGAEKIRLLSKADILVLPSWSEGFPNVVVEAMAAKVSVIVTAVGNVNSILSDKEHALIIPPRDVGEIVSKLVVLLEDKHFRIALAGRGQQFARDNFSAEGGIDRLIKLVEKSLL